MPPKKAPAKGKKGPPPEPPKTVEQLVNELADKELTVRDLSAKLAASLEEVQELTAKTAQLSDATERAKSDLHDINEFLTNQLKGSAIKVATLEARVRELDVKLGMQDKAHQAAFKQLNGEFMQERATHAAEMSARDEEAALAKAALEEQAEMREAVAAAKAQGKEAERSFKLQTEEVQRQCAEFKERVRRHAEASQAEFEAETRKNALCNSSREYASLSKTLQGTRKELEELAQQATVLMTSESSLRRELELARGRETDYVRRTAMFKRAITLLTDRVRSSEAQRQQHATSAADMHATLEQLEQLAQDVTLKNADSTQENATLRRELNTLKSQGGYREPIVLGEDVVTSLASCINGILHQRSDLLSARAQNGSSGQQLHQLSLFERQALADAVASLQSRLNKDLPKKEAGVHLSMNTETIGAWPSYLDNNSEAGSAWSQGLKLTLRPDLSSPAGLRPSSADNWGAGPLSSADAPAEGSGTVLVPQQGVDILILRDNNSPQSAESGQEPSASRPDTSDQEAHEAGEVVIEDLGKVHSEVYHSAPIRHVYDAEKLPAARLLSKKVSRVAFSHDTKGDREENAPRHQHLQIAV